jgi:hypothetical protein
VQFISLEAQPAALSRALPIPHLLGILSTRVIRICVQGGGRAAGHGVSSVNRRIAMTGGAISTTGRRSIHPAVQFISRRDPARGAPGKPG